jgi:superoxide dismutase, Cu-Zn family
MRLRRFVPFVACSLLAACSGSTPIGSPEPSRAGTESAWVRYEGGPSGGATSTGQLLPEEAGGPSLVAVGTFQPYRPGSAAITYDPQVVPPGARARVAVTRTPTGLVVRLTVAGMVPRRPYGAHLHTQPCAATAGAAGPHYQHMHDPKTPSVDPSYANPGNEVWLDFLADGAGAGTAVAQENWAFDPEAPPRSLVIHAETTRTGSGVAGTAGARAACLSL